MYPRIRQLRKDNDFTQVQVARLLGMSQTGYSKYETGENDLPTRVLITLADFYQTSIDYILGQTDVKTPIHKLIASSIVIIDDEEEKQEEPAEEEESE